jgi:dipeptidyl aminopeptidase/acylaminoacyl peptidase
VETAPTVEPSPVQAAEPASTLAEARRGHVTQLVRQESSGEAVPPPPPEVFQLVHYDAPVGKLAAYLTPDPQDGKKRPAIIWITGGDCNTIGEVWEDAPRENDQTASAYRKAGIVMMFPSLRGGNDNPGVHEGFYGEVDDVLAAADYLEKQPWVDPDRIYLGGHSTGGTLVLLVAEASPRFRATFAFGPVTDPAGYGSELTPIDFGVRRERELRAPILWLESIRSPTFVIEGADQPGNAEQVQAMSTEAASPQARFLLVRGADHFSILAPVNQYIAEQILGDDGPATNLSLDVDQLSALFGQ